MSTELPLRHPFMTTMKITEQLQKPQLTEKPQKQLTTMMIILEKQPKLPLMSTAFLQKLPLENTLLDAEDAADSAAAATATGQNLL